MHEIQTKFGIIYIEGYDYDRHNPGNREEEDRIKLYDSDQQYFDCILTDGLSKKEYNQYINEIKEFNGVDQLLDYLVINYEFYGTYEQMVEYLKSLNWENAEEAISKDEPSKRNEWINKIGDTYILISEF